MPICDLCHHHCHLEEGATGFCRVRTVRDGRNLCGNYGFVTSLALDPVEKKPLARFHPGSTILSFGSYGCNLRCPFCQNFSISQHGREDFRPVLVTPEQLAAKAVELKRFGNIGLAFTYNEPLLSWEFIRDTGRLIHDALAATVDAYNIDLKGFTAEYYRKLGGDLDMVRDFIREACRTAHVELTTLVVPGENDTDEEMDALAAWVASLSPDIPLHVSRFFPRWNMVDRDETPAWKVHHLAGVARKHLRYVYTGNC